MFPLPCYLTRNSRWTWLQSINRATRLNEVWLSSLYRTRSTNKDGLERHLRKMMELDHYRKTPPFARITNFSSLPISNKTATRRLKEVDLISRYKRRKPYLSKEHQNARLEWAIHIKIGQLNTGKRLFSQINVLCVLESIRIVRLSSIPPALPLNKAILLQLSICHIHSFLDDKTSIQSSISSTFFHLFECPSTALTRVPTISYTLMKAAGCNSRPSPMIKLRIRMKYHP